MKYKVCNIKMSVSSKLTIREFISKKLQLKEENIEKIMISSKSIDARKKDNIFYVYTLIVSLSDSKNFNKKVIKQFQITPYLEKKISSIPIPSKKFNKRPVVIGFGPAGMFCALTLSKMGLQPIVLERGGNMDSREKAVKTFFKDGILDENTNIQFGIGGAGTYSDGKLTTLIRDRENLSKDVFNTLIKHGAPEDIAYDKNPHIGTDNLKDIVVNIKRAIEKNGGDIIFNSCVDNLTIEDNKVKAVHYNNKTIETDNVILAIGHSARDTFEMLYSNDLSIDQKPFSIGVRIEHERSFIDKCQYGKFAKDLPSASYKLVYHHENKRSLYTFCMCPGGYVVPATSKKGHVVTNGMSYYSRNGNNSNSALLVNITPNDFNSSHPLAGVYFQEKLEKAAFELGGKNYKAPFERLETFLAVSNLKKAQNVLPSYAIGVTEVSLSKLFPKTIVDTLKAGIIHFDSIIPGFADANACLTGVESRSSSPIRILRNLFHESSIGGLYPCGEGAGYAGGITSSSIDGIKTAYKVLENNTN